MNPEIFTQMCHEIRPLVERYIAHIGMTSITVVAEPNYYDSIISNFDSGSVSAKVKDTDIFMVRNRLTPEEYSAWVQTYRVKETTIPDFGKVGISPIGNVNPTSIEKMGHIVADLIQSKKVVLYDCMIAVNLDDEHYKKVVGNFPPTSHSNQFIEITGRYFHVQLRRVLPPEAYAIFGFG